MVLDPDMSSILRTESGYKESENRNIVWMKEYKTAVKRKIDNGKRLKLGNHQRCCPCGNSQRDILSVSLVCIYDRAAGCFQREYNFRNYFVFR